MPSTVVGLYDDFNVAEQVVEDLLASDIPSEFISIVVNDEDDEDEFYIIQALVEEGSFEDDNYEDGVDHAQNELAEEENVRDLMEVLAELGLAADEADFYAEEVRRGRTMVTVNTPDDKLEQVRLIINNYYPIDIRIRAAQWQSSDLLGTGNGTGHKPQ